MARNSLPTAFDFIEGPLSFWRLAAEAQTVIALRTLGMLGLWNTSPGEYSRMGFEKAEAFSQAAMAATTAAMNGARPDQVAMAAIKPLQRKTKSNVARLMKAGPRTKLTP